MKKLEEQLFRQDSPEFTPRVFRRQPCGFVSENKALPIYRKYYRRYSARVKVNQIKQPDFKKWKYAALTKRDDCSNGKITVEEYIDWNEAYFPNRKRKDKQNT